MSTSNDIYGMSYFFKVLRTFFRYNSTSLMSARDPSAKLSNNTNESGILIYNKIEKASSTTVASYMFKFAAQNNNTHKHCPFGHFYMTDNMKTERNFLKKHYDYPKKPFSTDQHIVFVNAVEDYGFEEYERPNWINFVRQPIERLVSLFYFFKDPQEDANILLSLFTARIMLLIKLKKCFETIKSSSKMITTKPRTKSCI